MWVKQLIGRLAGSVVDVPYSAAQNAIVNGTAVPATDDDLEAAGVEVRPIAEAADPTALPAGYTVEDTEAGGFNLKDPGGVILNGEPHPNLPAAIDAAHAHRMATVLSLVPAPVVPVPPVPPSPPLFTLDDYRFEAIEGGGVRLFDPAGAVIGDNPYADEDAARLAARENFAAARGLSLEELAAEEAGRGLLTEVAVPEDWKGLHHTQRRALAARIAGRPIAATAEADEVIEEYVTRPAA
ncbi:hypothetical protein [Methylorubrum sp. SB2]|uniref:hypothetical protein n=1 Tax=Methylorubrum subtropicum TaxID=3138812 RepID=UPI00313EFA10